MTQTDAHELGIAAERRRVRVPLFPLYSEEAAFLQSLDGTPVDHYQSLAHQIDELKGTPQANVDWSEPDEWMGERLRGDAVGLAKRIWSRGLNPRHTRGPWYLARSYDLLDLSSASFRMTDRGRDFCDNPLGASIRQVDLGEGLVKLLSIVAERGPGKRGDFIPEWAEYLTTYSNYRTEITTRETMRHRLLNLAERGLVDRLGNTYAASSAGLNYLDSAPIDFGGAKSETQKDVYRLARNQRDDTRARLLEYLESIEPQSLETLAKQLLIKMGYQAVQTNYRNDKGVDVIADIEVGITQVREVVQVKRRQNNLHRTVLDQLRGSLHRFGAFRGTIMTTGGFSKGAQAAAIEQGGAPITLIDGHKLIDLLVEHGLGVRTERIELLELDTDSLIASAEPEVEE